MESTRTARMTLMETMWAAGRTLVETMWAAGMTLMKMIRPRGIGCEVSRSRKSRSFVLLSPMDPDSP